MGAPAPLGQGAWTTGPVARPLAAQVLVENTGGRMSEKPKTERPLPAPHSRLSQQCKARGSCPPAARRGKETSRFSKRPTLPSCQECPSPQAPYCHGSGSSPQETKHKAAPLPGVIGSPKGRGQGGQEAWGGEDSGGAWPCKPHTSYRLQRELSAPGAELPCCLGASGHFQSFRQCPARAKESLSHSSLFLILAADAKEAFSPPPQEVFCPSQPPVGRDWGVG